ncbi:MAG: M56 family metallopeptidase, partial [Phycisphaerales bacterium]
MNGLIMLFESEFCAHLTTALLHTLWQGALVAAALYLFLRGRPAEQAHKRYLVSLVALGAIVIAGFVTWGIIDYEPPAPGQASVAYSPDQAKVSPDGGTERATAEFAGPADSERAEAAPASRRFNWRLWAMGGWLAGAAVMLLRALLVMVGLGRLRLACRPLEDEAVLAVIDRLRAGMRIARRIRVVVAERILVPGVIGFVRPTLLLPVSMLSGVAVDDLRAVLAHELAHIRRFDYLVNFCQMVAEAVLFFNPAVWWISRQIRIEREACCDRAAVAVTGRSTRYAEVLARWARMVKRADIGVAAAAIVGFVEDGQSGTVLDRVKRIVVAGHRPRLRVSWYVAAAMMVLCLAVLVGLWRGTKLTVAFAGRLLTPQERIEMIAEINKTHGMVDRQYGDEDKILLSGVVRTHDGRPLTKNASIKVHWERPRHSGSAEIGVGPWDRFDESGAFSYRAEYGSIILLASAEGYAPAFAGPFEAEPGGAVSDIEIVLTDGFEGRIKVVDDRDNPVAGARLTGGYVYPGGSWHHNIKLTTDETGLAAIEHAASWDLAFQISADGFEFERINRIKLRPDQITILRLAKAIATTGVVRSGKTGEPVADAEIRLLISKGPTGTFFSGGQPDGPPDAVADESGRFELNTLRSESRYLAMVGAPGFGNRFLTNLRAGQSGLEVLLGEKKRIKGRVIGDLDRLETASGAPVLRYLNKFGFEDHSNSSAWATCPVEIRDGTGYFEIDDCWGQGVNIWVDRERFSVDVEKDPLDDVVIDLRPVQARQDMRQVVLRFGVPEGSPGVQGCVRVDYISEVNRGRRLGMTPKWLDIEDGRAACEIPVPGKFKYGIDYHQGKRPVGYWFEEISPIDVEPSDE